LVVYQEGPFSPYSGERVSFRSYSELTRLWKFEQQLTFPLMRGQTPEGYSITYDARMARKAFIEAHALKEFGGKVFWIDADVVTFKDVPEGFLDECLPDDKFCCHLGRDWLYTESGFIGFNANHKIATAFMETYLDIFEKGIFLTLPRWHDCQAFDTVRKAAQHDTAAKDAFVNLAEDVEYGEMHPFVKTAPGRYMDHLKGPRKKHGHSEEHPAKWWVSGAGKLGA
jgi:hypothetical protein